MINHDSIYALYPNVISILGETAYDANNNVVSYNVAAVEAHTDSIAYKTTRAKQYPSIADQLDMIWHAIDAGGLNNTSDFYTKLKAVKTANPKS